MAKKVKESFRWNNDTTPKSTDPMEKYLTFPQFRLTSLLNKLEVASQRSIKNRQMAPSPEEYQPNQLPSITCENTQVLWSPLWEEDEEEHKRHDEQFYQEWANVWNGCGGFHASLSWMDDEEEERGEAQGDGDGEEEEGEAKGEVKGEAMEL